MKFLINIADNETESFLRLLKSHFNIKAKPLSAVDAAILEELNHIKKAFKLTGKVKASTIKSRPASDF